MVAINKEIVSAKECVKDRPEIDNKNTKLNKIEAKIEQNLERHKNSLKFFEENDVCPTCTQPFSTEFKHQKCNEEKSKINTLQDGMEKLLKELVSMGEKITEYDKLADKIYGLNVDLSKVETSLDSLKTHSDNIEEDLKVFKNKDEDIADIRKQLNDMKDQLRHCKIELDKIVEYKKYQDVLRQVLNDKGAKAQIIKKYIPIMNQLINKYLQAMEFYVSFHLDEEFNETVKSRFRDTFNYNNFSEGEKMRIDLALLFTWRDIAKLKNSTNTNLLILDEIFDSSLDLAGTDDFFKIIQKLSNENVFIISHKGDILFDKFTNIIKYKKDQNFTVLDRI
jgi:DNA repair exonuclease SbcCD ATPase subunit